ncbi:hypothetical protein [Chengkuizengella marina]|nr:hypothetical protein [Chengkuizengella marina]
MYQYEAWHYILNNSTKKNARLIALNNLVRIRKAQLLATVTL